MADDRALSTAELNAYTASHSVVQPLLELLFRSGPLRLALGAHPVTFNGNTFGAAGRLLRLDALAESADGTEGLSITLDALDPAIMEIAHLEPYRGRVLNLYEAVLDPDTFQTVQTPRVEWRGRITVMRTEETAAGATAYLEAEHWDADARRPRVITYSDADQRRRFPNDACMKYIEQMTEVTLVWPDREALG